MLKPWLLLCQLTSLCRDRSRIWSRSRCGTSRTLSPRSVGPENAHLLLLCLFQLWMRPYLRVLALAVAGGLLLEAVERVLQLVEGRRQEDAHDGLRQRQGQEEENLEDDDTQKNGLLVPTYGPSYLPSHASHFPADVAASDLILFFCSAVALFEQDLSSDAGSLLVQGCIVNE